MDDVQRVAGFLGVPAETINPAAAAQAMSEARGALAEAEAERVLRAEPARPGPVAGVGPRDQEERGLVARGRRAPARRVLVHAVAEERVAGTGLLQEGPGYDNPRARLRVHGVLIGRSVPALNVLRQTPGMYVLKTLPFVAFVVGWLADVL